MRTPLLILLVLAALPCAARAEPAYCVATATELASAFSSAAQSPEASEIRVKEGFYSLGATGGSGSNIALQTASTSSLTISGGWAGANCSSQVLDPESTVLSGGGVKGVVRFFLVSQAETEIDISNLSFWQSPACLEIESDAGSDAIVRIDRNAFRLCQISSGQGSALRVTARSVDVYVRNNLFVDNSSGTGIVRLSGFGGSIFHVSNNTVANNPQPAPGGGPGGMQLSGLANDIFYFSNNVLWNNGTGSGYDLAISANTPIVLNANTIGERAPLPVGAIDIDTQLGIDPGFTGSVDFRPRRDSPIRNTGINPTGGALDIDFIGNTRVQGSRIDRGAFEYAEVFGDGFE
jgi:hypothetical protein